MILLLDRTNSSKTAVSRRVSSSGRPATVAWREAGSKTSRPQVRIGLCLRRGLRNHAAERTLQWRTRLMIIATRKDTDPHGNRWEEKVVRTGDETFRLEVRSDDPEDCFDANLTLQD